jgi:biofilm PGA synthesis N-glycosyltransferase PgaC
MLWVASISLLMLGLYVLLILYHLVGLFRLPQVRQRVYPGEKVNVIVPFRNEETNLPRLVSCLSGQDYPPHLCRVYLVNDHSSDQSLRVARSLTAGDIRFTVIDLPEGEAGKKAAIARAIGQAGEGWILQTDADCTMGSGWITSHMELAGSDRWQLLAGTVVTGIEKPGFLEAFEHLELLGLTGSAAGSFGWGRPLMCSGANLLYQKQLFTDTRRFDPGSRLPSGDDMFLMIGARKLGRASTFNITPGSGVITHPARDMKKLWQQRIRWAGKSGWYRMPGIQATAVLVALSAASVLTAIISGIAETGYRQWLLGGIALKCLADFILQLTVAGKTGEKRALRWFLPAWLLYQPFVLSVAAGSLLVRTSWKGRSTGPGRPK